jgi:hypothetical protein
MASKFCSACTQKLILSSFLTDPFNSSSKIRATCISCRNRQARGRDKKRKALQSLDPNISSKRPTICRAKPTKAPSIPPPYTRSETCPESSIRPLPSPESRPQAPRLLPPLYSNRARNLLCSHLRHLFHLLSSPRASCRQINRS